MCDGCGSVECTIYLLVDEVGQYVPFRLIIHLGRVSFDTIFLTFCLTNTLKNYFQVLSIISNSNFCHMTVLVGIVVLSVG